MRKIAVLCNYRLMPERVGGMDHFFWLFDAQCKAAGYTVHWFFPNVSTHQGYAKLDLHSCQDGNVEMYFLELFAKNEYTHIFTHFIELSTRFFKLFKANYTAKVMVVDHNPRPIEGYSIKKRLEKRLKGLLYARYIDVFIGVSEFSRHQMINELGRSIAARTQVIFNGLETEKFIKRTKVNFRGSFIVAAHLRKDKGIQDLIEAVRILVHQMPSATFSITIYGEGYYGARLKEMVQSYNLESFIQFKGSVSNLNELYQDYDYLIHPSHGETFCYSVVEALLCRLPVITTRHQGNVLGMVKESVNGYLFEEGNVAQLTAILTTIIQKKHSIDNSVQYNAEIEKLTLDQMVQNYFHLIQ